jgi:hypothetical protein
MSFSAAFTFWSSPLRKILFPLELAFMLRVSSMILRFFSRVSKRDGYSSSMSNSITVVFVSYPLCCNYSLLTVTNVFNPSVFLSSRERVSASFLSLNLPVLILYILPFLALLDAIINIL